MRSYCNAENRAVLSRSDYLLGYASVIFPVGFDEYYLLPIVIYSKTAAEFLLRRCQNHSNISYGASLPSRHLVASGFQAILIYSLFLPHLLQ